jgi:hypothetical protein
MELIILHLLIRKLRHLLPPENFRLIEDESYKLIKPFCLCAVVSYTYEDRSTDCLDLYNTVRPKTTLPDSILIDMIVKYEDVDYPYGDFEEYVELMEQDGYVEEYGFTYR